MQSIRSVRFIAHLPGICFNLGDFNAPHINWQAGSCSISSGSSIKVLETAEEEYLLQVITWLIRFREGNNPSILNLTFPKYPDVVLLELQV